MSSCVPLLTALPGAGTDGYETSPSPQSSHHDPSWFRVQNFTVVLAEEPRKIFSKIANDIISLLIVEKVSLPLTRIPISNPQL